MHTITIFLNIFNFSSFYLLSPNSLYNVPYELNINTDNNKCVMASVCGSVLVAITTRITPCVLPSHYNNSGFHIVSILIASTTQETSTSYKSPNNSDLSIQYSLVPIHSDGTTVRLRESVLIRVSTTIHNMNSICLLEISLFPFSYKLRNVINIAKNINFTCTFSHTLLY